MNADRKVEDLACGAELCTAVLSSNDGVLDEALGRIARHLLDSPQGLYSTSSSHQQSEGLCVEVTHAGASYGCYAVAGRSGGYGQSDHVRLLNLARLTGCLMQVRRQFSQHTHEVEKFKVQLLQQGQILDQIHESVMTMDLIGFITSWNKGAEQLFGYTASEAIGRNILFLYEDDNADIDDAFTEFGGREMEVRRRKKSGEIFWASLSLSPLRDNDGHPVGLIGYVSDITQRKEAEERIHHLAYYDALTALPNRSLLLKLVDQALTMAHRSQTNSALLFIDLNRFKPINDTLGHDIGNQLLKQVSERFRNTLREADLVARLGSDEFAVALFDIDQHYCASLVAQKLLAALDAPFSIGGHELRVGASIGISVYPQDGPNAETLLRLSDIAMYRAKQGGGDMEGGYAFYSQDMNQFALHRLRIESGLRHALTHDELLLHYQPKVSLSTGRIIGAEALVRWRNPTLGLVPPGDFIPVAEETGLVVQVGEWVLQAACAQAQAWQKAGLAPFRIAVNVSAREFTSALPLRVTEVLSRYEISPDWLELEITESTVMHNIQRVIAIMDQIAGLGVTLSLDDFGTGYSSLSYLKRFPIDTLKIDRSFITGIPGDSNDCAIASTIISIGKQLNHKVIAEGVENSEQLMFLKNAGCDEMQGFLFSRPVSADDFESILRQDLARSKDLRTYK